MMPYLQDDLLTLYLGDCLTVMATLPAESIDAVVTDPPYGLEFMGKAWDRLEGSVSDGSFKDFHLPSGMGSKRNVKCPECDKWGYDRPGAKCECGGIVRFKQAKIQAWHESWAREAFRVAKPGAHLLAFGGTRTYHRLASAIEDAGWEIRDCLCWCYASGFPKSSAPYRSIMSGICQYHDAAPHAVQVSAWHPLESPEAKEPTALALAEMQPEGELALLIRTGAEDASPALTVTLLSAFLQGDTNWNTAWSWDSYSADRWAKTSTFIIGLATKAITHQGIWNSLTLSRTPIATRAIESRPDGCKCAVLVVVESSTDGSVSTSSILWPTAHAPATSPLARLRGLGTAAKPAWEPIVLARKPLRGTVAQSVLEYGTGALNIGATRIGTGERPVMVRTETVVAANSMAGESTGATASGELTSLGRWPANLILTDPIFDGGVPGVVGGGEQLGSPIGPTVRNTDANGGVVGWNSEQVGDTMPGYGDSGTYSRFFLVPKSSRSDREPVVRGTLEPGDRVLNSGSSGRSLRDGEWVETHSVPRKRENLHPTVKPVELMRHLVRLVTPPGGTVLDCFLGSGSTAIAANAEGFRCIGIEREREYVDIAVARLAHQPIGMAL